MPTGLKDQLRRMCRASVLVITAVLLSVSFGIFVVLPENVGATTRFVGGGGPGNFTTIMSAIENSSSGDTIFVYKGTYVENVYIDRTITLIGEDENSTIIRGLPGNPVISIWANWVNISDFTLIGEDDYLGADSHGIALTFARNCHITNINATSGHNDGIYLRSTVATTISNSRLVNDGIFMQGSTTLKAWNTHTIDTSNTVNGKPVYYWKNVTGGRIPPGAGAVILANASGVVVENQNISNVSGGIQIGFSSGNKVSNNTLTNVWYGISMVSAENNTIINNTVYSALVDGLEIHFSRNNQVVRNNFSSNGRTGIRYGRSHGGAFLANTILSNTDYGIYIEGATNSTIEGNLISGNQESVEVWLGSNHTIARNAISQHWGCGVGLDYTDWNKVIGNDIRNGEGGICIYESSNNTVAENLVRSTHQGIHLLLSSGNRIYHNNVIDNTQQGRDLLGTNQWDDGYPSGGNYWSDYSGVDFFWGPDQDLPGADGIGDEPYPIVDGSNPDRYPLMYPVGDLAPRSPGAPNAVLSGDMLEDVNILWSLSPDDGNGSESVVRYDIFRGTSYSLSGYSYPYLVSLPNGSTEFKDVRAGEGDPADYFYRICAIGVNNTTSCTSDQAAKFTRPLALGPNLISVPLVQSDENIESVLQTVQYDNAWSFDSSSEEWNWHMIHKGYRRGLLNIHHGMGVWVNVTQNCNFTVAGIVPVQTMKQLHIGWNLVSFPSLNASYTVADLKADTGATRVEAFDPALPFFLRVLGDAEVLVAGFGYWVRVVADTVWTLSFG